MTLLSRTSIKEEQKGKTKNVLVLLGTLGSGKTTLVNRLLTLPSVRAQTTLVVVNDVGAINVDATRIRNAGEVQALTAGCIGCSDLPTFRKIINDAKQQGRAELVIIEPTGIADGREIRDAIASCGLTPQCITLLDVKHFERNRALNTLPSQLAVANQILFTWMGETRFPEGISEEVFEVCRKYAPGISLAPLLSTEKGLQQLLLQTRSKTSKKQPISTPRFTIAHGHHPHHHGAHTDHGAYAYSVYLRSGCSFEDIVRVLAPHRFTLLRAKGVVDGKSVDFVQGDLSQGNACSHAPFLNIITNQKMPLATWDALCKPAEEINSDKKAHMRNGDGISLENTLEAIAWMLEEYPPVLTNEKKLRVDCEADTAYQLAKRPGVPQATWRHVLNTYIHWRITAAQQFSSANGTPEEQAYWKKRLGMNIAWHLHMHGEDLASTVREHGKALMPARMALEGLLGTHTLQFQEEVAEERPEIIRDVIACGLETGEITQHFVVQVVRHCMSLCQKCGQADWYIRWNKLV